MAKMTCKKCGMTIDSQWGECPYCHTVYYILNDDKEQPEASTPETTEVSQKDTTVHGGIDKGISDKNEIFGTRVWQSSENQCDAKTSKEDSSEDADATKIIKPVQGTPKRPPLPGQPKVTRPAPNSSPSPQKRPKPAKKEIDWNENDEMDGRKKGMSLFTKKMIVAAVALLAVLTVVLGVMSGALDFHKGSSANEMINVVGLPIDKAMPLLEEMGLNVTSMREHSTEEEGLVIKQSVKEGKRYKKGDNILLTISGGKNEEDLEAVEDVKVIDMVGKTFDQAFQELGNTGLVLVRAEDVYDPNVKEGVIISQNPESGTVLKKGDLVVVTVSKGAEPLKITVTAGSGGTVNPSGVTEVKKGEDISFTITPDEGYEISEVKVDGKTVECGGTYTFKNVKENHTLYVVFRPVEEEPEETETPETPPESETPSEPPVTETPAPIEPDSEVPQE